MSVQKLISMACPNCGGQFQVGLQTRQFACVYCGAKWSVQRSHGAISLSSPADRMASELTIPRLEKEIDELILSLLMESEDREMLRERIAEPVPKLILGEVMQIAGIALLMMAIVWAAAVRITQFVGGPASIVLGALLLLVAAVGMIMAGLARSRMENERIRGFKLHTAELVTRLEKSRARSAQFERVLEDKREALERHKQL
ncbi:MAG TPA: hypothetical protein VER79_10275, partial [Candidatus Limnocylindrales bacterium]|nr:hypothetical protein [Candidatus Limnocylindrales bacterium]